MRTPFHINLMIIRLKTFKLIVPTRNQYAESNLEAIDCQIATLEYRMNENDCWNQWPTHHQGQDLYNRERALEASKWLYEEGKDIMELWQQKGQL